MKMTYSKVVLRPASDLKKKTKFEKIGRNIINMRTPLKTTKPIYTHTQA
jgi:hypothetical protein